MTNAKVYLITGGQRSGKSEYGEELALSLDETPTYLATSKYWDDEYRKRIQTHQDRRSEVWTTVEEQLTISRVNTVNNVLLLDCITLWITNVMDHYAYDIEKSYTFIQAEWEKVLVKKITLVVISNEIGLGVIPMEKGTRAFVDLQGKVNQYIAKKADEVTFMVSGLPLKVK